MKTYPKSKNIFDFSKYINSWIEVKKKNSKIQEGHIFGHDWNSMFPRHLKIEEGIKNNIYCALCILFREPVFNKDFSKYSRDTSLIERLQSGLENPEFEKPWWSDQDNIRSIAFIIYYNLKMQQEIDDNGFLKI